jgi:hypothetical protein
MHYSRSAARLLALLGALVFLAPAAAARADQGQPFSDPVLDRYLGIAAAQWGGPAPTCTQPDGTVTGVQTLLYDDPDPNVAARAEMPGCRIFLDRDYWPAPASRIDCTVIVHEWGHLLGHPHSSDPNNIMAETPVMGAPGCTFVAAHKGKAKSTVAARSRLAKAKRAKAKAAAKAKRVRRAKRIREAARRRAHHKHAAHHKRRAT